MSTESVPGMSLVYTVWLSVVYSPIRHVYPFVPWYSGYWQDSREIIHSIVSICQFLRGYPRGLRRRRFDISHLAIIIIFLRPRIPTGFFLAMAEEKNKTRSAHFVKKILLFLACRRKKKHSDISLFFLIEHINFSVHWRDFGPKNIVSVTLPVRGLFCL